MHDKLYKCFTCIMQNNTWFVLHKIFSTQAVNQLSTSQAQLHQVKLCCFLLRIGLFLACLEGDLYAVTFEITDDRQKHLKEMTESKLNGCACQINVL